MRKRIPRLKAGNPVSASAFNALAEQLEELMNFNVAPPLNMQYGPAGLMLGITPQEFSAGLVCKATKLTDEDWPSIFDWSGDLAGTTQRNNWDFELPATHEFGATSDGYTFEYNTTGWAKWTGSGTYVRAMNLTRHYVAEGSYCLLFSTGLPTPQYYFTHHMPPLMTGQLVSDLTYRSYTSMKIATDWQFGIPHDDYNPPRLIVHDRVLKSGYVVPANAYVVATLGLFQIGSYPVWRYVVTQTDECAVGE